LVRKKNKAKSKKRHQAPARSGLDARSNTRATGKQSVVDNPWPVIARPDELIEDVAIFSQQARDQLDEPLRDQAQMVIDSLALVTQRDDDAALAAIASIPRSSPYAQWRLLIRGLISLYDGDGPAAQLNWAKLEPTRRPYWIAAAIDCGEHSSSAVSDQPRIEPSEAVKTAAQRYTSWRLKRPALDAAEQIANAVKVNQSRSDKCLVGPDEAKAVMAFRTGFREAEPDWVRRFEIACVHTSCHQPQPATFEYLKSRVSGPAHDPHWLLLSSAYDRQFEGTEKDRLEKLQRYVTMLFPANAPLGDELLNAFRSQVWLDIAEALTEPLSGKQSYLRAIYSQTIDKTVADAFLNAVKAAPKNRDAHVARTRYLSYFISNDSDSRGACSVFAPPLKEAYLAWVRALPNDIEPRLDLVDLLLESDDIKSATAHINALAQSRFNEPWLKIFPWKVKLYEAMALTKLKRDVDTASDMLDAAEAIWPDFISTAWLPFLKAALLARRGEREHADELYRDWSVFALSEKVSDPAGAKHPETRCGHRGQTPFPQLHRMPSVVFDVLRFGAAQQMNLPADYLKPLRTAVDAHATIAEQCSTVDLLHLGAIFWDFHRCGMMYRGHRGHGSKFGKALASRLKSMNAVGPSDHLVAACLWAANAGYWTPSALSPIPKVISRWGNDPRGIAIMLALICKSQSYYLGRYCDNQKMAEINAAADNYPDPYYRWYFRKMLKRIEQERRFSKWRMAQLSNLYSILGARQARSADQPENDDYDNN